MARLRREKGTHASPGAGVFARVPFYRQRPLVMLALCALLGAALGGLTPYRPKICLAGLAAALLMLPALFFSKRSTLPAAMAAVLFLFMGLAGMRAHPALLPEGDYMVSAVVADTPGTEADGHVKVYLRDAVLTDAKGTTFAQGGAYWTYYLSDTLTLIPKAGRRVSFSASLYHPKGQMNPYGYDFRLSLLTKGISAGLYGAETLEMAPERAAGVRYFALSARNALAGRLDELLGAWSALPKALLLGVREELAQETRDAFARAGIAHVLAVSGLHTGLLAGALVLVLKRLLSPRARAYAVSLFLLLYCALLDFAPGVFRASVLMSVMLFSKARGRPADSLSALSLAVMFVLLVRPLDLFTYGFVLSFSAALGLALLSEPFGRLFSFIHLRRVRQGFSGTFAATTGTLVPASFAFHLFSPIGLLVSPAICAAIGVLIQACLALLVLSALSMPLAQAIAPAVALMAEGLERAGVWLGGLPFASVRVPDMPWPLIPAFLLLVWFVSPYCAVKSVKRRALAAAILFILGAGTHVLTIDHGLHYTQLSVGNADCAVLADDRETVVIDTGERAIDLTRYLLATGRRIDALVITHLHADHAAGIGDLLKADIEIGQVYLPIEARSQAVSAECIALLEALAERGVPIRYLSAGDAFSTRRASFQALWPVLGAVRQGAEANDYALALLLRAQGTAVLLASDVSGTYDRYIAQKSDVLKVSHHGGSNETTDAFLEVVRPRAALISTADGEKRRNVLERFARVGADTYLTDRAGAIRLTFMDGEVQIEPFVRDMEGE